MNEIERFNRALFLSLNADNQTPAWLIHVAAGIADGLIYLIPLLLLWMWLWGDRPQRDAAIKACVIAMLSIGVNQIIGLLWYHPRPFAIGLGYTWTSHAADSSFPSDHMTVFASVGLSLLFDGAAELAIPVLLIGAGVAWARIFLGIHFPLDMAGAFGVALGACGIVAPLWRRMGKPIADAGERLYRTVLGWPIAAGWIRR